MLVFVPIMLALCSLLAAADCAQINARLIGAALFQFQEKKGVDFVIVTLVSKTTYCLRLHGFCCTKGWS